MQKEPAEKGRLGGRSGGQRAESHRIRSKQEKAESPIPPPRPSRNASPLEAARLIVTVPKRGLQVASVDLKLVRNAFQVRIKIECEAVRHFTRGGH